MTKDDLEVLSVLDGFPYKIPTRPIVCAYMFPQRTLMLMVCYVRIEGLKQERSELFSNVFRKFEGMKKVKEESQPKESKNTR